MKKIAFFYVLLLPIVWCILAVLSISNSGDEHGLFAIGTFPATFIILFISHHVFQFQFNELVDVLPWVLLIGAILLSLSGLLLDWLRANKMLFIILFVVMVVALFSYSFRVYGSFERMRGKQGSVFAVVVFVCHLSLYMSIAISAVVAAARKLPFFRKAQIGRSD